MNDRSRQLLIAGVAGAGAVLAMRAMVHRRRDFSYRGRVVLITGGSRGLGLVLARQLVDEGALVAICARDERELQRAERQLHMRGGEAISIRCDVRDHQQVQQMIDRVIGEWERIDVLINNAGVIAVGPLDTMTMEDFRESMETNCWGALHTVLAVLPHMRRRGWGRIVNISSLGGKRAVPHMLPYAASKFALRGLSHGLRAELAEDGILVTTICPALMRTGSPRNASFKGRHREEYAWFSILDSLPVVSVSAERAARKILRACRQGVTEADIAGTGVLSVKLQAMAPGLMTEVLAIVNRMLPAAGGIGSRSVKGEESFSRLSPSLLTHLGEKAAQRNNEVMSDGSDG